LEEKMYLDMSYLRKKGPTADRPVDTEENPLPNGRRWYDTVLNIPVWWDADDKKWKNASGNPA